jgi:predicted alpha/beta superfamily hydrolase
MGKNLTYVTSRIAVSAILLAFGACSGEAQAGLPKQGIPHCSVVGELEVRPFSSKVFGNTRMLRVWLPPGYNRTEHRSQRYPVLYLNDGQDLFDACTSIFNPEEWRVDETATELIQSGKIPGLIIVGIDNAGKRDRPKEYLPFADDTLEPAVPSVHGKDYPRFLVDEVMPFINREYGTDPDPENTGLGGSSYGAGIALYTVMMRPGRFGKLLLESPSLYAHDDYLLHQADKFTRWPAKIFIGVGSVNEPVDDVHRLQATFGRHGLGSQRLLVVEQPGAGHNEDAWADRFPRALQFLYGTGTDRR